MIRENLPIPFCSRDKPCLRGILGVGKDEAESHLAMEQARAGWKKYVLEIITAHFFVKCIPLHASEASSCKFLAGIVELAGALAMYSHKAERGRSLANVIFNIQQISK